MSTIVHIAKKAGVSPRTVSRVLNTGGYVSKKVVQKVLAIAEELDYQPHAIARGLVSQKTGNIGFILCDRTLSHPFYFRIFEGVEKEVSRQGYRLFYSSAEAYLAEKTKFPHVLKERVLDGILLSGKINSKLLYTLKKRGVPIVMIGLHDLEGIVSKVASDNRQGGYEATCYLLNLGHRRIGFFSGPLEYAAHKELLEGYKSALQQFGIDYEESLLFLVHEDKHKEASAIIERLLRTSSPPTAIFAVNDTLAIKTMEILRENGLNIPEDMSIIGFGDIELSRSVNPHLTSVKTFESKIAQKAVNKLIEEISDKNTELSNISIPIELVVRESCAQRDMKKSRLCPKKGENT